MIRAERSKITLFVFEDVATWFQHVYVSFKGKIQVFCQCRFCLIFMDLLELIIGAVFENQSSATLDPIL